MTKIYFKETDTERAERIARESAEYRAQASGSYKRMAAPSIHDFMNAESITCWTDPVGRFRFDTSRSDL